jgi:homoserine kinase
MFIFVKMKILMSKSYKIKVPATSANLGPGFDCIGIALNLYNEFIIKKSSEYKYKNILDKFCNEDNLFIKSAKCVYQYYQMDEIKFELEIIENVPISRGLGSSATCIIGGLIAGFLMLEKEVDQEVVLLLANKIEGHPDNVAPAYLGGLVCSFIEDEKVYSYQYQVSNQIKFNTLIVEKDSRNRDRIFWENKKNSGELYIDEMDLKWVLNFIEYLENITDKDMSDKISKVEL